MGPRCLIPLVLLGCHAQPAPTASSNMSGMPAKVAADFEAAVRKSKDAYVELFDFAAVGEMEILLHRYDLNGRMELTDEEIDRFSAEDGTPYPAERERRNVGNFYTFLATRTVGQGGCVASEPRTKYGKLLAQSYEPLPEGTPEGYEILRTHANAWMANGGVVRIGDCKGGKGGLALVYTQKDTARGYDLITIYDD